MIFVSKSSPDEKPRYYRGNRPPANSPQPHFLFTVE